MLSAYLPKEASRCALDIYQQDRAREQALWQNQQDAINQQRRREGLNIPNGEAANSGDSEDSNGQNGDNEPNRADTWYDRAVQWF